MKFLTVTLVLGYLSLGDTYSKYGRSCKDIGCATNEECVMATDPCSYYQREGECGSYPTCKKTGTARTCATFVCPLTQVCKMDGNTPKCYDDHSKVGRVRYDTQNQNAVGQQNPSDGSHQPSAPNLYPSIPRGETTPRPNVYHPPAQGGGYRGGQIGSGYPGQGTGHQPAYPQGYPQQPSGYPQQPSGYPQGYPQGYYPQGYQQGYYPQGYQQGYNSQGYSQGGYTSHGQGQGAYQPYPGYGAQNQGGGYNQGYGNRYGQQSSGSSFTDKISGTLKNIGLFCILLNYLISRMYGV